MGLAVRNDDLAAVLSEVDRFAARAVEPKVARPEAPLGEGELAALLEEARAVGILASHEESGLGVWEDAMDGDGPRRSVLVLARLARGNAGFALAAHRAGAGRWLAARLGLEPEAGTLVAVQGRFGLGRVALARHLAGAPLDEDDRAILDDAYGAGSERLFTADGRFTRILAPVIDGAGGIAWASWPRDALEVRIHPRAHGLDELTTFSFRLRPGAAPGLVAADGALARASLGEALALESFALVAIALGAAERAHGLARRYAAIRRQGGRLIDSHPAVQLLLASSRGAIAGVAAQLESLARRPLALSELAAILALRAEAHPLLCRGGNDALQVLGGTGYMRDMGMEKVVRDLNHLRATCGTPAELGLFVAEWERLHA